ncbi:hypothetical protein ACHAWF_018833 [Thalassiosira exigua]
MASIWKFFGGRCRGARIALYRRSTRVATRNLPRARVVDAQGTSVAKWRIASALGLSLIVSATLWESDGHLFTTRDSVTIPQTFRLRRNPKRNVERATPSDCDRGRRVDPPATKRAIKAASGG